MILLFKIFGPNAVLSVLLQLLSGYYQCCCHWAAHVNRSCTCTGVFIIYEQHCILPHGHKYLVFFKPTALCRLSLSKCSVPLNKCHQISTRCTEMIADYFAEIKIVIIQSVFQCHHDARFNSGISEIIGRKFTKFVHDVAGLLPFNILKVA